MCCFFVQPVIKSARSATCNALGKGHTQWQIQHCPAKKHPNVLVQARVLRGVPLRTDVQGGAGAARGADPDQQPGALVLRRAGGLRALRGRHLGAQVAPVISCGGHYMVGLFLMSYAIAFWTISFKLG